MAFSVTTTYDFDGSRQVQSVTAVSASVGIELAITDIKDSDRSLVGTITIDVSSDTSVVFTNKTPSTALFTSLNVNITGLSGVTGVNTPTDNFIDPAYSATFSASTDSTTLDLTWRPKKRRRGQAHFGLKGSGTYSFTYS